MRNFHYAGSGYSEMRRFLFGSAADKGRPKQPTPAVRPPKGAKPRDELQELRGQLQSGELEQQQEAMRKIVLATAEGKDCGVLYMDVLKVIGTNDESLKRLVYEYVTAYAAQDEGQALLSVNSLVLDSKHHSAHVRGMAIRAMGNIRLSGTAEYFVEPMMRALDDGDGYVRKSAVLGLVKLMKVARAGVDRDAVGKRIAALMDDRDAMVAENVMIAAHELPEVAQHLAMDEQTARTEFLLEKSSGCRQALLVGDLKRHAPANGDEAERIVRRVLDKADTTDAGVVMEMVGLLAAYSGHLSGELCEEFAAQLANLIMKLGGRLTGEKEYEALYILYRSVKGFICAHRELFVNELSSFYISYDDPHVLRSEKLDILLLLANDDNAGELLRELREDSVACPDYAERTLSAMAEIGIKCDKAAGQCINALVRAAKEAPQVQEDALVAAARVTLARGAAHLGGVSAIMEQMDSIRGTTCKSAVVTMCGAFPDRIANSREILDYVGARYTKEPICVRLALLSAASAAGQEELVRRAVGWSQVSSVCDERERSACVWRGFTNGERVEAGCSEHCDTVHGVAGIESGYISSIVDHAKCPTATRGSTGVVGNSEAQGALSQRNSSLRDELRRKRTTAART